jgi:hypothetical protein
VSPPPALCDAGLSLFQAQEPRPVPRDCISGVRWRGAGLVLWAGIMAAQVLGALDGGVPANIDVA